MPRPHGPNIPNILVESAWEVAILSNCLAKHSATESIPKQGVASVSTIFLYFSLTVKYLTGFLDSFCDCLFFASLSSPGTSILTPTPDCIIFDVSESPSDTNSSSLRSFSSTYSIPAGVIPVIVQLSPIYNTKLI